MLADNFWYANGVAVARDQSFVAVAETMSVSVHKYWLSGPKVTPHLLFALLTQVCVTSQVARVAVSQALLFD